MDDIIVYSSDTDFTPFDKGAYASRTTYVSGGAVLNAAMKIKEQILRQGAKLLVIDEVESLTIQDKKVVSKDGRTLTLAEIALSSLHQQDQHQIMATASHLSPVSPPPTAAQFVEVTVDTETGIIQTERMLMVVDCGRVINPITAAGQVEGGMSQALGFSLSEEMLFDESGKPLNAKISALIKFHARLISATDVLFLFNRRLTGPLGQNRVAEMQLMVSRRRWRVQIIKQLVYGCMNYRIHKGASKQHLVVFLKIK